MVSPSREGRLRRRETAPFSVMGGGRRRKSGLHIRGGIKVDEERRGRGASLQGRQERCLDTWGRAINCGERRQPLITFDWLFIILCIHIYIYTWAVADWAREGKTGVSALRGTEFVYRDIALEGGGEISRISCIYILLHHCMFNMPLKLNSLIK